MGEIKRATIKQVAQQAGVSTQTVSRVINHRPDVAPETRQRVQQVIDSLSYQPSALARSLIQQRSYTLGVVTAGLKYIGGPARALSGITAMAEELGYALLLRELPKFTANDVDCQLQALLTRHVDGIIWAVPEIGENHDWLDELLPSLPAPILFLSMHPHPRAPVVAFDNLPGGRLATNHLLECGYRHIGHLAGPLDWWEARQRKEGWQATLAEAGLSLAENQYAEGNWSSASGEQAFLRLLDQYPNMDAVFVANDQMALSVLQVASRKNIKIPQELGVIGFDGIAESAFFWPSLTTISQDQQLLGHTAVNEIVAIIEKTRSEGGPPQPKTILLAPQLIVRESTNKQSVPHL